MNSILYATTLPSTAYMTNNILKNLINFCAPLVAIALVIFCVLQGFQIFKGGDGASVKKLVTGVLLILFILGIMYAAGSFKSYGDAFKGVTDKVITNVSKDSGNLVG